MELWYTENHTDNIKFSIKVNRHLYSEKSEFQQVDIFESEEIGRFLTLDGLMMVNEKDEFMYHDMIVHPSFAVNPKIRKVLVIGGGDGGTVREITRYPEVEKIDMVEIDELVVKSSIEFLEYTSCKLNDKRVTVYFEDGIEFVKDKEAEYDLIIVDSTDPIGPGEGLFTRAFYNDCFKALTEDGILVNQNESPYYSRDAKNAKRAHMKIREIFPVSKVYDYHMPTYPSGHWMFGFASKGLDPLKDIKVEEWNKLGLKTKYYNTELHSASFALPNYVKEILENE